MQYGSADDVMAWNPWPIHFTSIFIIPTFFEWSSSISDLVCLISYFSPCGPVIVRRPFHSSFVLLRSSPVSHIFYWLLIIFPDNDTPGRVQFTGTVSQVTSCNIPSVVKVRWNAATEFRHLSFSRVEFCHL